MRTLQLSLAALAIAVGLYTLHPRRVRAQSGCNLGHLTGTYVYTSQGYFGLPQGIGFFAAAGKLTFNGDGTFSGIDTASSNGTVQRNRATSGTYSVTPDCRGTVTYKVPSAANVDFIISSAGQAVHFIQSDSGTVIAGSATLQVLPPDPQ